MTLSPSTFVMTSIWECIKSFFIEKPSNKLKPMLTVQSDEDIAANGLRINLPPPPSYISCQWCRTYYTRGITPKDCQCNKSVANSKWGKT